MENGSGWTSDERAGRGSLSDAPQLSKRDSHGTQRTKGESQNQEKRYRKEVISYHIISSPTWRKTHM